MYKQSEDKKSPYKKSIYEVNVNPVRKGVSGWKLTKKMPTTGGPPPSNDIIPNRGNNASGMSMQVWPGMNQSYDPNASTGGPRMMEAFSGMGVPTPSGAYRQSHMTAHLGTDNQPQHIY